MAIASFYKRLRIKREYVALFIVLAIAFFLRLYHLGFRDFWHDEITAASYARSPWLNWNAPLYWISLHYWVKLFGISESSLRFPSLIFSFLSLILIYFLGKEFFDKKTGIVSSFFMGASPFHLWYAQEAREYSMLIFAGIASTLLLCLSSRKDSNKLWLSFVLCSLAGMYTSYFYIFLLFSQSILIIFNQNKKIKLKGAVCLLMVVFGFFPYLHRFLSKFDSVRHKFWIPEPGWGSLITTYENFVLGFNGFNFIYLVSMLVSIILLISAIIYARRYIMPHNFLFCLSLAVLPVCFVFIFSKLFFSIYLPRGLILFSPYYYIILSLGLNALNKPARHALLVVLFSIFIISEYRYFTDCLSVSASRHIGICLKKPLKPVVKFLRSNSKDEDMIILASESIAAPFTFYSQKDGWAGRNFFHHYGFNNEALRDSLVRSFDALIEKIAAGAKKNIWIVSSYLWGEKDSAVESPLMRWCERNLKLEFVYEFDSVIIFKYARCL